MCDATQGNIQLAAELMSLDNLGSPGGEERCWTRIPHLSRGLKPRTPHEGPLRFYALLLQTPTDSLQIYPGVNQIRGRLPIFT